MQTIETLKRKIKTAEDLQSVVKTMKTLAAVNIRQYERAVESLADYNRTIEMGLQVLLRGKPEAIHLIPDESPLHLGAVVFGSDQGMCGPLNDQVAAYSLGKMGLTHLPREKRMILAVGLRVAGRLQDSGQYVEETLSVPSSISGITPAVQELVTIIEGWHFRRGISLVWLFYSEHLSGASYRPKALRLLPIDAQWLRRIEGRPWPTRVLPTFTMEWEALFSRLIRQYLFVSLYRAFAESLASENASRLASMQGAERNIEERLGELQGLFHRQRQMSITEELLDIVAGYEALGGPKEGHPFPK